MMVNVTTSEMPPHQASNSCIMFPDNPHRCDTVIIVHKVAASLSFSGCVFILFMIWLFKKYLDFSQRLVLYMSVAVLFNSVSYLMSHTVPDSTLCNFQGWWLTFFDWSVLLWVVSLTFNLYMTTIKSTSTEKYEVSPVTTIVALKERCATGASSETGGGYHVLCWVFPLLVSCLPFISDHYGPAGAWCWIVEDWKWRLGVWYGPLFIILTVLSVIYAYVIIVLRRKHNIFCLEQFSFHANTWEGTYTPDTDRAHQMLKEDIKPLRYYPLVYLAVSIFPIINKIQNTVSPDYPVFALVILESLAAPLLGAINAVIFTLNKDMLAVLRPHHSWVAFQSHFRRQEVREYPVAYRSPESSATFSQDSQPPPKFQNVSYSKLH